VSNEITYCPGNDSHGKHCPLRNDCLRYKTNIVKKKMRHWDFAPYNWDRGSCSFQLFKDGRNLNNNLDAYLDSLNGRND